MSSPIIRCENVGKRYHIQHKNSGASYTALRDVLASKAKGLFRRSHAAHPSTTSEEFWALKDMSFEVQQGEVVGIIGKNGAGKSTLLKILSRITEPTTGRITLDGRVASLLEVGTGFHPELTGRENVFLNGAILGMSKAEIRTKFDEIVAFAEVEKFLDTPVKRYSSGMYVRLAFAVAAHLEPEILVVDEVLAVGDAQFQKKCLGKMQEVSRGGRTVLFVSHNMAAVTGLCSKAIWLANGIMVDRGETKQIVDRYLSVASTMPPSQRHSRRHTGEDVRVESLELLVDGVSTTHVQAGQPCAIRVHYRLLNDTGIDAFSVSLMLSVDGQMLTNLWTNSIPNIQLQAPLPRAGYIDCLISKWPYRGRSIHVDVFTHTGHSTQDWIEEALVFDSHDGDYHGSGIITNPDQGLMFLDHTWRYGSSSTSL